MEAIGLLEQKRRKRWPIEEKLRIVEQTLEQGASVAGVALANGVNANQVRSWKRKYERGELRPRKAELAAALIPVRVVEGRAGLQPAALHRPAAWKAGSVTVEFAGRAVLRIEGAADPAAIRAVVESLSR